MKIAVFGDSFAAKWPDETLANPGWVSILEDFYYIIDNYAVSGSSLYYSWKKFKSCNLEQYDKVIFVVTNWSRFSLPCENGQDYYHIPGLNSIDIIIKNVIDSKLQKTLDALRNYLLYVNRDIEQQDMQKLMLADILLTRPDILIVPAFNESDTTIKSTVNLRDLGTVFDQDTINHLPLNIRQKLAYAIHIWISTGKFVLEK